MDEIVAPAEPAPKTPLELALARCEGQIAELQHMIGNAGGGSRYPDHAELVERLSSLESRLIEAERTIRHTMSILIEWIERDEAQSVAA